MKVAPTIVMLCASGIWLSQEPGLPIAVAGGARPPGSSRRVEVTLRFDRPMPADLEVTRLVRAAGAWRLSSVSRRPVHPLSKEMMVAGPPDAETLLLMRAGGLQGYLLDGPFRWPHVPSIYFVSPRWRRTVRGQWPRTGVAAPTWVGGSTDAVPDAWPRCAWVSATGWECIGVPLFEPGVVVASAGGQVAIGPAAVAGQPETVQRIELRPAAWARLIAVRAAGPAADATRATLAATARRLPDSGDRTEGVAVADARVRVEPLGRGVFLASSSTPAGDGWLEISQAGRAPARITIADLAASGVETPLPIALEPAHAIFGTVVSPGGPVRGALITLMRSTTPSAGTVSNPRLSLVVVSRQRTDDRGVFRFDDLAMESYELVVTAGAGSARLVAEPDGQPVTISVDTGAGPPPPGPGNSTGAAET